MSQPRVLIAGIGNIFLGDDAFGSEVARQLLGRSQSPDVQIVDFGIRGLDLTYALMENPEIAILIDAVPAGLAPGTVSLIEPDLAIDDDAPASLETHGMNPVKVMHAAVSMGARPGRVLLVGCEPSPVEDAEEMQMEMSEPVRAAVDEAVRMVESIVEKLLRREPIESKIEQTRETVHK